MKARDILAQYYDLDTRIRLAEREIEDLREKATAIGSFDYAKDRVKSSAPMGARYEKLIEKLVDRQDKLAMLIDELVTRREEITKLLDIVTNPKQHEVLHLWYIEHKTAEQIADKEDCSSSNIYYLRAKGLDEIDRHLMFFE